MFIRCSSHIELGWLQNLFSCRSTPNYVLNVSLKFIRWFLSYFTHRTQIPTHRHRLLHHCLQAIITHFKTNTNKSALVHCSYETAGKRFSWGDNAVTSELKPTHKINFLLWLYFTWYILHWIFFFFIVHRKTKYYAKPVKQGVTFRLSR